MYLIINGYEFGQWLCVLLWIGLPVTMYLTMWTTWFHYRRGRVAAQLLLLMEGVDEGGGFSIEPEDLSGDGRVDTERSVKDGEEDYKENLYKGILWMKEKYEAYRDLADERYERLKEQLTVMEKKYEDLLAKVQTTGPALIEGEAAAPREVNGDGMRIRELEEQHEKDRQKIDELVAKLRNNSQLLLNIYQELDKSLHFSDTPQQPQG